MRVLRDHSKKGKGPRTSKKRTKGTFWGFHRSSSGSRSFPRVWADLRRTDRFCDGMLESSDGKVYRVHRVIMVAASEYFRAVFTSPLALSGSNVKLPFPSNIVNCIVDYSYTGHCHVGADNVECLLPAADQIGVMGVVNLCAKFLRKQISTGNCWGIHNFCRAYFIHKVAEETRQFMLINFSDFIRQSYEFIKAPLEDIISIVSDDYLNVPTEEVVFQAVDKWIMYDCNERKNYATRLFSCVRMGLFSSEFFHRAVLTSPYINMVCPILLNEVRNAINDKEKQSGASEVSLRPFSRPRAPLEGLRPFSRPRVPYEVLFAVGGWSAGTPTNCVETYDIRADRWFLSKQSDLIPRSYHGLVTIDNLLYMIGGFDGSNHFNTMRCYDPVTKEWSEKACMYHARCYVCCVVLGRDIYAIGGFNGRIRMCSAEKYSIATNQWEIINPMNRQRSDGGAAVVGNKIYVVGGFNGQEVLYSAEVYDSTRREWAMLPPMRTPRSGVSLVYFKGYLYALGGFNGYSRLSSVERLDPNHPIAWTSDFPEMLTQRSNFACAVMDDMIFVVGGFNGTTTTAYTECFNGKVWREVSNMNLNRSALAICICRGLPNTADYTLLSRIKHGEGGHNATGDGNATGDYLSCSDESSGPILESYDED